MDITFNTLTKSERLLAETQRARQMNVARLSGSDRPDVVQQSADRSLASSVRSEMLSTDRARLNVIEGISILQTAEGLSQQLLDAGSRMRELAVQANNDSLSADRRNDLQAEFTQLQGAWDNIANFENSFDGSSSGANAITIQVGPPPLETFDIALDDLRANTLGLDAVGIGAGADLASTIDTIDAAVESVQQGRIRAGGQQNRLELSLERIDRNLVELDRQHRSLTDIDVAKNVSQLTRNDIVSRAGLAVSSQGSVNANSALTLLGI